MPRHYDAQAEERKEREERIRKELESGNRTMADTGYRERIAGSFRGAKKTSTAQADPSANMMRLILLLFLTLWLIAVLQFGTPAIYGILLIVPFYFFLKFRKK